MPVRQTHTFALLEVSQTCYDEIAGKLRAADYGHVFGDQENGHPTIDMHGLALVPMPLPDLSQPIECPVVAFEQPAPVCGCDPPSGSLCARCRAEAGVTSRLKDFGP